MSNLEYSKWHRQLGYSFFAMDVDYIEIREGQPVAVIEASLCTNKYPECEGINGVFNRFLKETGGFQLDMAYWVAKWLNIPAFVICLQPPGLNGMNSNKIEKVHVLSLTTGEEKVVKLDEYKAFINDLPNISRYFSGRTLELPELLDTLIEKYSGLNNYPYFKFKSSRDKWLENYEQRKSEVDNGIVRESLEDVPYVVEAPVKGETTHTRPFAYEEIRKEVDKEYINLEWVEWRKDFRNQSIGRPAAILKTVLIENTSSRSTVMSDHMFLMQADESFEKFKESSEYNAWNNISQKMHVDWFYVAYSLDNYQISPRSNFKVWKNGSNEESKATKLNGYTNFLKRR